MRISVLLAPEAGAGPGRIPATGLIRRPCMAARGGHRPAPGPHRQREPLQVAAGKKRADARMPRSMGRPPRTASGESPARPLPPPRPPPKRCPCLPWRGPHPGLQRRALKEAAPAMAATRPARCRLCTRRGLRPCPPRAKSGAPGPPGSPMAAPASGSAPGRWPGRWGSAGRGSSPRQCRPGETPGGSRPTLDGGGRGGFHRAHGQADPAISEGGGRPWR